MRTDSRFRCRTSTKPMPDTTSAAAMTKAKVGSQRPKMSRNPSTFVGCVMPEISKPKPKISPLTKLASANMIDLQSRDA